MTIRVLIVDDHDVVAEGLRFVVSGQPDMMVTGCVQDSQEAVRIAIESVPDIVLMDHAMPILNGTAAAEIILKRCPQTRIIMVSMHSNQIHVVRALQAGAAGYIVKRSAAKEVVEAIRTVRAGGRYLSPELKDLVLTQSAATVAENDPLKRLSARERQVLQMLAEGQSVNAIASTLGLSPKTVETYRSRMMEKLDIHDFASLIRFALQHGVTPMD